MTILCYLGIFLCGAVSTFSMQKYGRSEQTRSGIWIYALVTGAIAMGVFWTTAGFSVTLNPRTILYAAFIAVLAIASYFTELPVYRFMGVAEVAVITTGGTLILSSISGVLLFHEELTVLSILRILLMLAAILVLFFESKHDAPSSDGKAQKKLSVIGLLFCIGIILIGTLNTIATKYIAIDPLVTNENSLFFFTNVLVTAFAILCLFIENRGRFKGCLSNVRAVSPIQYLMILGNTVASNISSLLGVLILENGNLTLYVPLSNALKLLSAEAIVLFALRERPKLLPVLLASASMLLGFFG